MWKGWNKITNNKPNIAKSYNKATYIAGDIKTKKIRDYNSKNSYASWENMKIDGTSKFIDNEGIIERSSTPGNIYSLACGPANANEYLNAAKTIKNTLYQKECAK